MGKENFPDTTRKGRPRRGRTWAEGMGQGVWGGPSPGKARVRVRRLLVSPCSRSASWSQISSIDRVRARTLPSRARARTRAPLHRHHADGGAVVPQQGDEVLRPQPKGGGVVVGVDPDEPRRGQERLIQEEFHLPPFPSQQPQRGDRPGGK